MVTAVTAAFGRTGTILVFVISMALIALGATASAGFFTLDEVIYSMGAQAFVSAGRFTVENGAGGLASADLGIWLLRDGSGGFVPQYPVGSAVVGSPLVTVFGEKALIVLNVAAGIGTLVVSHALARRLFLSRKVADLSVFLLALCSFWAEYVLGHWPHSVSIFATTLALLLFVGALDRADRAWIPALLSGLAVGMGVIFRLEVVLVLPVILAATILYAVRPVQVFAGGAVGLAPMLGLLAFANHLKFGTWNPLSYGSSGGGTDLSGHLPAGAVILLVLAGLVVIRRFGSVAIPGRWLAMTAALAGFLVLTLPSLALMASRLATGVQALLLDATTIVDPRSPVRPQADGTQLFWGLPKKALGQSLPWLGCLALLAGVAWGDRRRSVVIVLMFFAIWAFPFLMLSWHGGLGSNMRYFLPTMPALCALAAWLILRLVDRAGDWRPAVAGCLAAVGLAQVWLLVAPDRAVQLHQIASTYALYAVLALSLVGGLAAQPALDRAVLIAVGAGVGLAMTLALGDFRNSQHIRVAMAERSQAAAAIPGRVVFYGPPKAFAGTITNPDHLIALPALPDMQFDFQFIANACAADFRVVMPKAFATGYGGLGNRLRLFDGQMAWPEPLVEVDCAVASPARAGIALTSRSD